MSWKMCRQHLQQIHMFNVLLQPEAKVMVGQGFEADCISKGKYHGKWGIKKKKKKPDRPAGLSLWTRIAICLTSCSPFTSKVPKLSSLFHHTCITPRCFYTQITLSVYLLSTHWKQEKHPIEFFFVVVVLSFCLRNKNKRAIGLNNRAGNIIFLMWQAVTCQSSTPAWYSLFLFFFFFFLCFSLYSETFYIIIMSLCCTPQGYTKAFFLFPNSFIFHRAELVN